MPFKVLKHFEEILSDWVKEAKRMADDHSSFRHPLGSRYTDKDIKALFSDDHKFFLWRKFWWVSLRELGRMSAISITQEALDEMEANLSNIDYDGAAEIEAILFHDVLTHAKTFGLVAPLASGFIHDGNTACDVTDNMEQVTIREALKLEQIKLARTIHRMSVLAETYADLPILGRTHLQPAQPTTLGKRICMWIQDLLLSLHDLERFDAELPFRGVKGVVGTQASFLEILVTPARVDEFDRAVAKEFGFSHVLPITGQTYTRWLDATLLTKLAVLASSIHKIGTDLRLMQSFRLIREPSSKKQAGSTAQPYKRNPMKLERACAIARRVIAAAMEALMTHAVQWEERSLDDSAARRIYIADAFLAIDACLKLLQAVFEGLEVFPAMIKMELDEYMPFLASEIILAEAVKAGLNRQEVHAQLNLHARVADDEVMNHGRPNNYLELVREDPFFAPVVGVLGDLTDPMRFVGLAPQQTRLFVEQEVRPVLAAYHGQLGEKVVLAV
jgi:adenylosuccinate lyase